MGYTFSPLSSAELLQSWPEIQKQLPLPHIFVLPQWLKAWWCVFGGDYDLCLGLVKRESIIVGLCPMKIAAGTASLIGSADVCDYLDFVVLPGEEAGFFECVRTELKGRGVSRLDLEALRPDAVAMKGLSYLFDDATPGVCQPTDVSLATSLDGGWEGYLGRLASKQRHEMERKLRRLEENGQVNFRIDTAADRLPEMLRLMRESRSDKAAFMTATMEQFFYAIVEAMASLGMLRLGFLTVNGAAVASVLCFDYDGTRYLYNSGYDPAYAYLSVGLLSKVLCVKEALERKMQSFDFLKGAETYKYQLGGQEIVISRCQVALK